LALAIRLVFSALMADTFDPDEFVYLTLGRAFARGAVPYRDFMFFSPPGMAIFLRALDPLTMIWWPVARLAISLIDCVTAICVWRLATHLYGRRIGLVAGVIYAAQPIAVLSAVRVGEDPIVTALGMSGLTCLVVGRSWRGSVAAGVCLLRVRLSGRSRTCRLLFLGCQLFRQCSVSGAVPTSDRCGRVHAP
jgi:hypothetical protein